jgi:hypothetical protein
MSTPKPTAGSFIRVNRLFVQEHFGFEPIEMMLATESLATVLATLAYEDERTTIIPPSEGGAA